MGQTSLKRDHELHVRRRGRNLGVLGALTGLAIMLFVITIVKMGEGPGMVGNPTAQQGGAWDGMRDLVQPQPEVHVGTTPDRATTE
ncbi:MAG: hypothetical protein AAFR52_16280 [Pseudomonadota bacterium]